MKQSDTLYKYDNEYLKILYWCKIFINFFVSIVLSVKFYCGVLTALAIAKLLDARSGEPLLIGGTPSSRSKAGWSILASRWCVGQKIET